MLRVICLTCNRTHAILPDVIISNKTSDTIAVAQFKVPSLLPLSRSFSGCLKNGFIINL
ncbi:hypothetical protein [Anaerocolumna jejuensis]|uniref:hypothetical protein n=1 Tax=Anaerocolumna jejuensis TaxID=259063 RepID=UPI003F7B613E